MKDDGAAGHILAADDSPSARVLYPEWQNEYQSALLELDREKLSERVAAAEAFYTRLQNHIVKL